MPTTGHRPAAPTTTRTPSTAGAVVGGGSRAAVERERRDATTGLAELICADPQWLDREFAELIAANYPPAAAPARTGPPGRPGVATTHPPRPTRDRPGDTHPAGPGPRTRSGRSHAPADGPARQRSPPGRRARWRHRLDEPGPGGATTTAPSPPEASGTG